jgi:hypothetical protein
MYNSLYVLALFILELKALKERKFASGMRMPVYYILEAFRRNNFDVLINIKILTEGTDIPDIPTVFLTRETKSDLLLTQMSDVPYTAHIWGGQKKPI